MAQSKVFEGLRGCGPYVSVFVVACALSGCVKGSVKYTPPEKPAAVTNFKVVEKPRDAVWNALVPGLGKRFFVINNLDKSSGLINVSFSGPTEKYLDCGTISSFVENMRGPRTYNFNAASSNTNYESYEGGFLLAHQRRMSLEGRVNVIVEEVSPSTTRVTANTRYVVTRTATLTNVANPQQTHASNDSISFGSEETGVFPSQTACVSTGALESELLSLVE
jgi:hypothetical protein